MLYHPLGVKQEDRDTLGICTGTLRKNRASRGVRAIFQRSRDVAGAIKGFMSVSHDPVNHPWQRDREELYLMSWLSDWPYACVSDLANLGELDVDECRDVLDRLRKSKDVASVYMGAAQGMTNRYFLTGQGVSMLFGHDYEQTPWATTARGIRSLADRLEFVEETYRLVPSLLDPGRVHIRERRHLGLTDCALTGFEWRPTGIPHAIARYGDSRVPGSGVRVRRLAKR